MKPLAGLKVLELARILAGPWVGQLLADLGADVVKVERPGAGDDTRGLGTTLRRGRRRRRSLRRLFPFLQPRQALHRRRFRDARGAGARAQARSPCGRRHRELQGRRPEEIRARLREPETGQSAPRLLLDHRLRPGRALRLPRRLRFHDPGHGRHHGPDRRSGRRAAEDRRRLCGHLHRGLFGRRHPRGACANATPRGRARISTWRSSTCRRACSPTRP